jgi:hypothetical protein
MSAHRIDYMRHIHFQRDLASGHSGEGTNRSSFSKCESRPSQTLGVVFAGKGFGKPEQTST